MPKKTISVRVPEDTYAKFEDYRRNRPGVDEISKTDAGRRLLESALSNEWKREMKRWALIYATITIVLAVSSGVAGVLSYPFAAVLGLLSVGTLTCSVVLTVALWFGAHRYLESGENWVRAVIDRNRVDWLPFVSEKEDI